MSIISICLVSSFDVLDGCLTKMAGHELELKPQFSERKRENEKRTA
jgi:hypothetical protein